MYTFVLIFVWRRKLLFLSCALIFLIGIWAWAIFYTAYTNNKEESKKISIQTLEGSENVFNKYGLQQLSIDDPARIRFMDPTSSPPKLSSTRFKEHFKFLDSILFNKDSEKILQNLDMPSRDEIGRRRDAERIKMAADIQGHYEHELQRMGVPVVAGIGPGGHQPPNQRLVHLDLKGAPPMINYLKRLLPIIKSLGATGLLIEYEDMFPYTDSLDSLSAKNAYTKKEIKELLHSAATLGLSVMPLVQTFGHLEFALKLKEFQHLREVPESPQSICPSLNNSMIFIEEMISQVVGLHSNAVIETNTVNVNRLEDDELLTPNFTHLHIGCDEVYRMGECPRCKSKTRDDLFLTHVFNVATVIRKRWPNLKIVIWDDMLRHVQVNDLEKSKIGTLVEPMVWVYAEDIYRFISSQTWDKYSTVFPTAWAASAFKGAHGEQLFMPPARRHLENNLKWLAVMQGESARFSHGMQGIALTGWQRYDHFAVLCELLPAALPILALCLSTVSKGYFDIESKDNPILSALTCPEPSSESISRRPWIELHQDPDLGGFSKCMFPGSPVFRFIQRLDTITTETKEYLNSMKTKRGWITDYNIRHNFSSPIRVEELITDAIRLTSSLSSLSKNAIDTMYEIYDRWTIDEFIELHINPLVKELRQFERDAKALMSVKVWPRRPLPYLKDQK